MAKKVTNGWTRDWFNDIYAQVCGVCKKAPQEAYRRDCWPGESAARKWLTSHVS